MYFLYKAHNSLPFLLQLVLGVESTLQPFYA